MPEVLYQHAAVTLPWLVRLRWLNIGGQLLALTIAQQHFGVDVAWPVVVGVVALGVASNAFLGYGIGRSSSTPAEPGRMRGILLSSNLTGWVLTLDTFLLTGILLASGASSNPFTILYLVQIVLAALVLNHRWTGGLTLLSACCFAALFAAPAASCHVAGNGYSDHLRAMWIAFAVAAGILAYFVQKVSRTIETQRAQIVALAERARESAHMASLTTLAAGAAHELRTPLGTIAVATHELRRRFSLRVGAEDLADVDLIEAEVERCQEILWSMGPRFLGHEASPRSVSGQAVLVRLAREFPSNAADHSLVVHPPAADLVIACVEEDLLSVLRGLVRNALDAVAGHGTRVALSACRDGASVCFRVEDDGAGMPAETLTRATEPFFTTKQPGCGLGLGLFLANTYAASLGGALMLRSAPGAGTCAELRLPLRQALDTP